MSTNGLMVRNGSRRVPPIYTTDRAENADESSSSWEPPPSPPLKKQPTWKDIESSGRSGSSFIPEELLDADEKVSQKVQKSFTTALLEARNGADSQDSGCWRRSRIKLFGNCDDTKSRQPEMTRLIHPSSLFARGILFISSTLLMYTALVVPVILAFEVIVLMNLLIDAWALLDFDLFVDTFFITEIFITFFMGIYMKGKLIDEYGEVAKVYLQGAFWFDLITSIPVSYLELWAFLECQAAEDGGPNEDVGKLKIARLIKPIRVVRMIRVIRAMKNVDVSSQIERLFNLPPMFFRLFRVLFTITSVTHLASCAFWLTKVQTNDANDIEEFLALHRLPPTAGITQKYILCTYFLISIFTTVGFGDVHASNTWEQVIVIIFMLVGVLVFGTLLSEVQSGVMELRKLARDKGLVLQQLKNFLRLVEVPQLQETKMLNWVDFEYSVHQENMEKSKAMEHLTGSMQLQVQSQIIGDCLSNVDLLNLSNPNTSEMYAVLWAGAVSLTFQEGETIMHQNEVLNSMLVVHKGSVRVETLNGDTVVVLVKGDAIGEWALMQETPVKNLFGFPVVLIAHVHTQCCAISKRLFDSVLSQFPEEMAEELQDKFDSHRALLDEMGNEKRSRANMLAMARWFSLVKKMLRKHKVSRRRASDQSYQTNAAGSPYMKINRFRFNSTSTGSPLPGSPPSTAKQATSPTVREEEPVARYFEEDIDRSHSHDAPSYVHGQYLEIEHKRDEGHIEEESPLPASPRRLSADAGPIITAGSTLRRVSEGSVVLRGGLKELDKLKVEEPLVSGRLPGGNGGSVMQTKITHMQAQVTRVEHRISKVEDCVNRVEETVGSLRQDLSQLIEAVNSIQQTVGAPVAHMQAWGHREYLVDRSSPVPVGRARTPNTRGHVGSRKVEIEEENKGFGRSASAFPSAGGGVGETTFSMRGRNMGKAKMYSSSLRNLHAFSSSREYEAKRVSEAKKDANFRRAASVSPQRVKSSPRMHQSWHDSKHHDHNHAGKNSHDVKSESNRDMRSSTRPKLQPHLPGASGSKREPEITLAPLANKMLPSVANPVVPVAASAAAAASIEVVQEEAKDAGKDGGKREEEEVVQIIDNVVMEGNA